jgi:hypothetical protein
MTDKENWDKHFERVIAYYKLKIEEGKKKFHTKRV